MKNSLQTILLVAAALAAIVGAVTTGGTTGASQIGWLVAALLVCASAIASSTRWGTVLTAVMAASANAYLLNRKLAAHSTPSFCNVNQYINCDLVNSSAASEMFGIPITVFGVAFYSGLALAALLARANDRRLYRLTGLFAVVTLIYSVYLAFESYRLGAMCVVCVSLYAANGLLLWAGMKGLAETGGALIEDVGETLSSATFATISGVFVVVTVLGAATWQSRTTTALDRPDAEGDLSAAKLAELGRSYARPGGTVVLDGSEPILGDPNAPYMVVEWADFGCPHCAEAYEALHEIVKRRPDVQVRFRTFPLTSDCNPALQSSRGKAACIAAIAADCANQQGKFWQFAGLVFHNQGYVFRKDDQAVLADMRYFAEQVSLDESRFEACLADPATAAGLERDATAGYNAGVRGTPALFLKGVTGDGYAFITSRPEAILELVAAHAKGVALPPPGEMPAEFR
jgi:protein-disulfide isomerase/uncharacterized membrane protein